MNADRLTTLLVRLLLQGVFHFRLHASLSQLSVDLRAALAGYYALEVLQAHAGLCASLEQAQ